MAVTQWLKSVDQEGTERTSHDDQTAAIDEALIPTSERSAHDDSVQPGAPRRGLSNASESGGTEHGCCPDVGQGRAHAGAACVDRVALDRRGSCPCSVIDRGDNQRAGDTLSPKAAADNQTDNAPGQRFVGLGDGLGPLEALERVPRTHRAPPDRLIRQIGQQPWAGALLAKFKHTFRPPFSAQGTVLCVREPIGKTPAALRPAGLGLENRAQVSEVVLRGGPYNYTARGVYAVVHHDGL